MKNKKIFFATLFTFIFITTSFAQIPNYVPTNGLVGWWSFNGNANDQTINGNNGTVSGATLTDDRLGNPNSAYVFDGINDFIEIPGLPVYNGTELTVGFWAKGNIAPSSTGGGAGVNPGIFTKLDSTGNYPPPNGYYFYEIGGLANVSFGSIGGTLTYTGVNIPFTDSLYHFLLFTYKENDTIKYYVDNELVYYSVGSNMVSNNKPIRLGTSNSPFWKSFEGIIDDIAIYNGVLDSSEITSLYTGTINQQPCLSSQLPVSLTNGMLAWYPFCGNASDESGNGNNGSVSGATLSTDRFGNLNSAYSFNGSSNYIDVNDTVSLRLNNTDYSISFWTNLNAYGTGGGTAFIYKRGPGSQNGWCIGADQGTQDRLMLLVSGNVDPRGYSTATLGLSDWHNVVVVYTLSTQELKFYIDGILDNTTTGVDNLYNPVGGMPTPNSSCTSVMRFGQDTEGNNYWLDGQLDDIGIWNRALTPNEVNILFTTGICFQTVTVTDTLIINANLTGFNPVAYQNSIKVYPNPSNDHITIDCGSNFSTLNGYSMRIDNSIGQTVFSTAITQQTYSIDLNTWTGNGLYLVYLLNSGGQVVDVRKIVIQ